MDDGLPQGWTSTSGIVEPAETVAAYAARRQAVKGACKIRGCYRRLALDPMQLCGKGFGRLTMTRVQRFFECNRPDEDCALDWHKEPAGIPLTLGAFIGKPNIRVRVRCRGNGCRFFRVWKVEEMIAGLIKRKQGDERTEIDKLPAMMTSGCSLCGKSNWAVEVLYVNPQTVGWKQLGERAFDSATQSGGI